MPKAPVQSSTQAEARPRAIDVLVNVAELALSYKYPDRVATISEMSRTVSIASRLLRYSNLDEKIELENQVIMVLAKRRQLIN
jgi:hypothetical protein